MDQLTLNQHRTRSSLQQPKSKKEVQLSNSKPFHEHVSQKPTKSSVVKEHKAFPRSNIEMEPAKQTHDQSPGEKPVHWRTLSHSEEPRSFRHKYETDKLVEGPNIQDRHQYLKYRTHFQKHLAVEAEKEADAEAGIHRDYHYRPKHAETSGEYGSLNEDEEKRTKEETKKPFEAVRYSERKKTR
jgi:hypothetical protein